jgi:hypothetical protein
MSLSLTRLLKKSNVILSYIMVVESPDGRGEMVPLHVLGIGWTVSRVQHSFKRDFNLQE